MIKRYIWNLLVALDQLLNAVTGGDPDETPSSRISKRLHLPHWRMIGRLIEKISPGHLARSREDDEGGNSSF